MKTRDMCTIWISRYYNANPQKTVHLCEVYVCSFNILTHQYFIQKSTQILFLQCFHYLLLVLFLNSLSYTLYHLSFW